MFDTVRLVSPPLDLDLERLWHRGWQRESYEREDAEGMAKEITRFTLRRDSPPHYLRYSEWQGLRVEVSLPKLLYGENVSLLKPDDLNLALDELSNQISDLVGDIPHVRDWQVRGRADAVFQWQTAWDGKEHTAEYLHAFKMRTLPRHHSLWVDREATLYWRNKTRAIRMYDKYRESRLDAAKGFLRLEVQMNRPNADLRRLASVSSIKAADVLTWQSARAILAKYLTDLGANSGINTEEQRDKRLIGMFGAGTGRRLMGTIRLCELFSQSELTGMGLGRATLRRDLTRIRSAGIAVGTTGGESLPPLTLPDTYTGEPGLLVPA